MIRQPPIAIIHAQMRRASLAHSQFALLRYGPPINLPQLRVLLHLLLLESVDFLDKVDAVGYVGGFAWIGHKEINGCSDKREGAVNKRLFSTNSQPARPGRPTSLLH